MKYIVTFFVHAVNEIEVDAKDPEEAVTLATNLFDESNTTVHEPYKVEVYDEDCMLPLYEEDY